jgi:Fe-S-cluster-containing dehydrogenase component/CRP-like cAMP-binding protein
MTTAAASLETLLSTPLFDGVDDELLDGLRVEAKIRDGEYEWEPGSSPRAPFLTFHELREGDVLATQGELATSFVVVLHGHVQCVQARAGRDVYEHRRYGPQEWFGEVTAVSSAPALATYRADCEAQVAKIDPRMFKRLYAEDETFQQRIDAGYLDNLGLHLRLSPLCKDLDDQAVAELQAQAELVSFEDGEVVIEQGTPCEDVYLVRTGGLACFVERHGGERTLAFYKGNATFGEHALMSEGASWPASYRTLMQTSLIKLPRRAFSALSQDTQADLARAANRLIGEDDARAAETGDANDAGARSVLDELFVMVERESVKGGRALVIDQTRCVRCNMCVESCEAVHDDGIPRLSKVGTPIATDEVLITACYHCDTPQCMLSCEYSAIRRDPQGRVRFEYDMCVGCAGCIDGCPYGVIRLVEKKPAPPPPTLLQSLPVIGRLFGAPPPAQPAPPAATDEDGAPVKPRSVGAGGNVSPVNGKTIKCDLCAGLPFEACVYNCPTTAILRKEPQGLFDRSAR